MLEIVKDSGFCHGVRNAVNTADLTGIQNGRRAYLFGDLVNNTHVMNGYRERGFTITNDVTDIEPGSTVIIRAHGIPKTVYAKLLAIGATVEDCTCIKVKRIHGIVESAGGSKIIIVGKKNHPEVIGIRGWCKNGEAIIVENEDDLNCVFSEKCNDSICVVGQTTCNQNWWHTATEHIKTYYPHAEIHNTLCDITTLKNDRARELARLVDTMVVIGDEKSANSTELYETCRKVCANTIFVSSLDDLQDIAPAAKIGLVGSASAPADAIDKIHEYLAFLQFLDVAKGEIVGATVPGRPESGSKFITAAIHDLHHQNTGGKCIRGALIKLGEAITSQNPAKYLQVAAAYEIFQTAILIHDDMIDRSGARRGKATIHSQTDPLTAGMEPAEAAHYASSRALCIGDLGLFTANSILANADIDDKTKVRVFREFSRTQLLTIEGEIMDVLLPYEPICPAQNYDAYMSAVYEIYRKKTAAYTLQGPLVMGAICGGASEDLQNALRELALPVGVAFQIKDDLLGMYASDEVLGKPAISDLQERKQTSIYGYAYKHASDREREILDRLYGNRNATPTDLETVRDIFTAAGARQFAEDEIRELSQQSLDLIAKLPIDEKGKTLLRGLVHYLTIRKY